MKILKIFDLLNRYKNFNKRSAYLMLTIGVAYGAAFSPLSAMAAATADSTASSERVILGSPSNSSGATLATTLSTSKIAALQGLFQDKPSIRVIVGVRVPFAPEGYLSTSTVQQQRSEITTAQNTVLQKITSIQNEGRSVKKFDTIPFMALEISKAELDALLKMPEITSMEEDKLSKPLLAESVPLIGATGGAFAGFNGINQVVAVLDTGVDKNHPDLAGRVVSEACYSTTSSSQGVQSICPGGVSESTATNSALPYSSGVCISGGCDHGTHVAGIAAGVQGVARGAKILAIQVFSWFPKESCDGTSPCAMSYSSDQIKGLERINSLKSTYQMASANMSLGGGSYTSTCDSDNLSIKSIIDTLRSNGVATVIASGNEGYTSSIAAPACISTAVSVGATWDAANNNNSCKGNASPDISAVDAVTCYSNSSSIVSLLAPGSLITAPIPNGGYGSWQGTSMATPHVAGAWAVLKEKAPTASVSSLLSTLQTTGKSVVDTRNNITKPRINVLAAINSLSGSAPTTYQLEITNSDKSGGTVTSSPSGITCGSDCLESYNANTKVTLLATPNTGYKFSSWSGDCTDVANPSCSLVMDKNKYATAIFEKTNNATLVNLSIAKVGTGDGGVVASNTAIQCGSQCSDNTIPLGTTVTLTAVPDSTSTFAGWSGSTCSGTGTCAFSLLADTTITAHFNAKTGGGTTNAISIENLSGSSGATRSYSFTVPSGASNLMIKMAGGTGNADLYARYGAAPTVITFDCRPYLSGNNETCYAQNPTAGTYYLMIRTNSTYSGVTLGASYQTTQTTPPPSPPPSGFIDMTPVLHLLLLSD